MRIFVSYSRRTHDQVRTLIREIEGLGHTVSSDHGLVAGHAWWQQILAQIRDCEVFLFALAPAALESPACKRECQYAHELNKVILPVVVSDGVSFNLLPPALSAIQSVDYRAQDRAAAFALVKAVSNLPAPNPPPDPLPQPPLAPISYLGSLKDEVETTASLSFQDQSALWLRMKVLLADSNERADVRAVLGTFRRRVDLFAKIAEEIDVLLQSEATPAVRVLSQRRPARHKKVSKLHGEGETSGAESTTPQTPTVSPIPAATPRASQQSEWHVDLISRKTLARTLRIHLTRDTHVIELAIETTIPAKAVVKLGGQALVESSIPFSASLATGAHAMRFAFPDGDERREAKIDTDFSIWSGRIKRLRLSVDGKHLYDDERAAAT